MARSLLDYYVILAESGAAGAGAIVVEELVLADDGTATGLDSAGWSAAGSTMRGAAGSTMRGAADSAGQGVAGGGWWSSAAFARELRTDAGLRGRAVPVRRREAESAYRRLAGAELPGEGTLRGLFQDRLPLAGSPPLVLTPPEPPDGFHELRVYRVLFAGDLGEDSLPRLREVWRMSLADPRERVVGTADDARASALSSGARDAPLSGARSRPSPLRTPPNVEGGATYVESRMYRAAGE